MFTGVFINTFTSSGLFYLNSLDRSISCIRGVWLVFITTVAELFKLNANSVDPDQTLRSAASDLGLHCLSIIRLLVSRLKCVKKNTL